MTTDSQESVNTTNEFQDTKHQTSLFLYLKYFAVGSGGHYILYIKIEFISECWKVLDAFSGQHNPERWRPVRMSDQHGAEDECSILPESYW